MAVYMSAAYGNPRATLDGSARVVHVSFEIRNTSTQTWRKSEGFALGYHLFDAETGTVIVDGPRVLSRRSEVG